MKTLVVAALLLMPAIASAETQSYGAWEPASDLRIDTYDRNGARSGHIIVNGRTGRVDQYDANANRTGDGTINGGRVDTFDRNGNRSDYLSITGPSGSTSTKR